MKIAKRLVTTLACLLGSNSVYALDWSRVSGELLFASIYTHSDSNLYTQGNPNLEDPTSRNDNGDKFIATPLGNINYALDDAQSHRLYIGTSRDDLAVGTLAFELGYQRQLDSGTTFDLAYLPTVLPSEVWADPYTMNQAREKTDVDGDAFRLKLSNISSSLFSLDMAYARADIENDQVTEDVLKRDSKAYYIKGQYLSMLDTRSGINYGLSYTLHNAEGKANSHNKYSAEASYFFQSSKYAFALTGTYTHRAYKALNPIFNRTQSDNAYRLFFAYEYKDLPNWDNWSVSTFAGTTKNNSNIEFFDSREWLLSLSLNYAF